MKRHALPQLAAGVLAAATIAFSVPPAPGQAAAASAAVAAPVFQGRVTTAALSRRVAPSTHVAKTGTALLRGTVVAIDCQLNGTVVDGNQRWYKVAGRNQWISARYVANVGRAPYACSKGDWAYRLVTGTNIRRGPSTADVKIGSLPRGAEINTRWFTTSGQSVLGSRRWVAVETPNGNRGWVTSTTLRPIG